MEIIQLRIIMTDEKTYDDLTEEELKEIDDQVFNFLNDPDEPYPCWDEG